MNRSWVSAAGVSVIALLVACSSDGSDKAGSPDASVEGGGGSGSGGRANTGGAAPGAGGKVVVCGGETCQLHNASGVDSESCCTDDGACGVHVVFLPGCLPQNRAGGIFPTCEMYTVPAKITMPGCCGPDGCGAFATFDSLGCIPNVDLGRPKVACGTAGAPGVDDGGSAHEGGPADASPSVRDAAADGRPGDAASAEASTPPVDASGD
jgi:hypothetical protein